VWFFSGIVFEQKGCFPGRLQAGDNGEGAFLFGRHSIVGEIAAATRHIGRWGKRGYRCE
jgi:hypothetical protein